jgi:hypothetical protein
MAVSAVCTGLPTGRLVLLIRIIYCDSSATILLARMSVQSALRPHDPAIVAIERRRDEHDLAWLRQRVRRDCSDAELEAALAELALLGADD